MEITATYAATSNTLYGQKIDEYTKKQSHGTPPSKLMQPISKELTKKYLADQSHLKIRGRKIKNNEPTDVNIKNMANGFSRAGTPVDAPLTNAIDVRLNIKGMLAPTEQELRGFAKAGFNESRFFKALSTVVF